MLRRATVLLSLASAMSLVIVGCAGYVPGRKAYWDAKVTEMCEKDGGVTVFERVNITEKQAQLLWGAGLPVPTVGSRPDMPYYWTRVEVQIRESNPQVVRAETMITRRSDGKLLGKSVRYSRRGGDLPTGISEATSFACPEHTALSEEVFAVGKADR